MLKRRLRQIALNWLVKDLLRGITEEDILRTNKQGGIIYRGRPLNEEEADNLQREAEVLQNSNLINLLLKDMEYLAQQQMFNKSLSMDDIMFGKAILYTTDILKKKINNLAK